MILILVLGSLALQRPALAFGYGDVVKRAKALAATSYTKPAKTLPRSLQRLAYQEYRQIRMKPEKVLWAGEGTAFEVSFFHPGRRFDQPVKVNVITAQGVREIPFDPRQFDYGNNRIDPAELEGLGYAGFRVLYPVNDPERKDELLSFLGASYFRAVAPGQVYGLSARGLAIDTGLPSGEEFPRFVEFWIARPARADRALILYALLDSPRVTGAYRFLVTPGEQTVQDVRARLFLREPVARLGVAPLTSMYFFGENQPSRADDYRPEVHDSDGLSIHTADDQWIWRPLVNPKRLLVTSFAARDPVGFGLMQRDGAFASYQDTDAAYQHRPSAWVAPKGKWGAGRIELVQIPTPDETNDNIVAYWVPDEPPPPGQPYELEYRLMWASPADTRPPLAHVVQTRRGRGYPPGSGDEIWLRVDFAGPTLDTLAPEATVHPVVTANDNGELTGVRMQRNEALGGWRITLQVRRRDQALPVELRAHLNAEEGAGEPRVVSETWSYILPPD
jgi:glucans biosynthesis protein